MTVIDDLLEPGGPGHAGLDLDTPSGWLGRIPRPRRSAPADLQAMDLLAGHVPLSLIMDLAMPTGPHSTELLLQESYPLAGWLQDAPETQD